MRPASLIEVMVWGRGGESGRRLACIGNVLAAHISIVLSCLLLLWGGRLGLYVAMLQLPFRLIKAPSVSILLVMPLLIPGTSPWLWLGLCLVSECLKGVSLRVVAAYGEGICSGHEAFNRSKNAVWVEHFLGFPIPCSPLPKHIPAPPFGRAACGI